MADLATAVTVIDAGARAQVPVLMWSDPGMGSKSTAFSPWHTHSGVSYGLAAAARLVVVRQQFSVGGIQPFTAAAYGKRPMSAKLAVATNRPLLWLDTGRLGDSLGATAALRGDRAPGVFWFSWPEGASPADVGEPTGVLDGLTWPARSLLLHATEVGSVDGIMLCDGLRWPQPLVGELPRDLELIPHTSYARKKTTDPYVVQGVHPARAIWRQLAAACADADNPAARWQPGAAERGGRWRLGGLGSFQSAIYGPLIGSFPAPRDPAALAVFLDAVTAAHHRIGSAVGSMARGISDIDGYAAAIPGHGGLAELAEPIAGALAAGRIGLDAALAELTMATEAALGRTYAAVSRIRPLVAGRTAARKASTTSPS